MNRRAPSGRAPCKHSHHCYLFWAREVATHLH